MKVEDDFGRDKWKNRIGSCRRQRPSRKKRRKAKRENTVGDKGATVTQREPATTSQTWETNEVL